MQTQVDYGQRPAGSSSCGRWRGSCGRCCPAAASSRSLASPACATSSARYPGKGKAIVLGAHYDTLAEPEGFVGANNGASGTAIVIGAARALRSDRPAGRRAADPLRALRRRGARRGPARGAGRLLRRRPARLPRLRRALREADAGDAAARLRRQQGPAAAARGHVATAACGRRSAQPPRRAGVAIVFPDRTDVPITDDHTPFLRAGVPAVDFIDWSYDGHSLNDGMDKISVAATDAVGETVVELLRSLR